MRVQDTFSTGQVRRLTGATARQLDYWAWEGFLRPSGQGAAKRRYSFDDLVRIRVVMRLKDQGVTLQVIRKAVSKLQEFNTDPLRELRLVGLNGDVFIYRSLHEVERATDGQTAFLFMDIGEIAREVDQVLAHAETPATPGEPGRVA